MAAIAGVATVITLYVALFTRCIMILVEAEIFFMLQGGRFPAIDGMTLRTVALDLPMQLITWHVVATVALLSHSLRDQFM